MANADVLCEGKDVVCTGVNTEECVTMHGGGLGESHSLSGPKQRTEQKRKRSRTNEVMVPMLTLHVLHL